MTTLMTTTINEVCPKCGEPPDTWWPSAQRTFMCGSKHPSDGAFTQHMMCSVLAKAYERGKRAGQTERDDSLLAILARQMAWSMTTFGPRPHVEEITAHIRKELNEIAAEPEDLEEWIDVVILALDGAWRTGATREQIVAAIVAKQTKNEGRTWPDWRTHPEGVPFEHVREGEEKVDV